MAAGVHPENIYSDMASGKNGDQKRASRRFAIATRRWSGGCPRAFTIHRESKGIRIGRTFGESDLIQIPTAVYGAPKPIPEIGGAADLEQIHFKPGHSRKLRNSCCIRRA
jgi:hypothetical protein